MDNMKLVKYIQTCLKRPMHKVAVVGGELDGESTNLESGELPTSLACWL